MPRILLATIFPNYTFAHIIKYGKVCLQILQKEIQKTLKRTGFLEML